MRNRNDLTSDAVASAAGFVDSAAVDIVGPVAFPFYTNYCDALAFVAGVLVSVVVESDFVFAELAVELVLAVMLVAHVLDSPLLEKYSGEELLGMEPPLQRPHSW